MSNYETKADQKYAKIKNIEDEIPDITNLSPNASFNANVNEVKGGIPKITSLATNASLNVKINEVKGETSNISWAKTVALTAVENKITNVSNLVNYWNWK